MADLSAQGTMHHPMIARYAKAVGGLICALDTSATDAAVLLASPDGPIVQRHLDATALPSESLMTTLVQLAQSVGLPLSQLRAIVVGLGPGSYTGLRVGLATAKGLALGAGAGILGFSSLAAIAGDATSGVVLCIRDALRGKVYMGCYQVDQTGCPEALMSDALVSVDDVAPQLADVLARRAAPLAIHLRGDGRGLVASQLARVGIRVVSEALGRPDMAIACQVVAKRLEAKDFDSLTDLVPQYLRASLGG